MARMGLVFPQAMQPGAQQKAGPNQQIWMGTRRHAR